VAVSCKQKEQERGWEGEEFPGARSEKSDAKRRSSEERAARLNLARIFLPPCHRAVLSSHVSAPVPPALLNCRGTGAVRTL
jgi:hypothetical protein